MNMSSIIFDEAERNPERVRKKLIELHEEGETVEDILEFIEALEMRKISVPYAGRAFDVCGTGGSGKKRINLSTALAILLSKKFPIAKHGNRGASGRVGSFDIIEAVGLEISDTPEKVKKNLTEKNLAFVFAPAFHPALKPLAPIRKSIPHPTIFNFLGPLLNPLENITAQIVGVPSEEVGEKLSRTAQELGKNVLFVYDREGGLDDVSILGETVFWEVKKRNIKTGTFVPEDFDIQRVENFEDIQGGNSLEENVKIFRALLDGTASESHLKFLEINARVAEQFFQKFTP
ncbi:anthranilate phosphoribosyltransferase [Candidatus Gracilibacteria bacterium]|nr:anthranilate phosphoribosyltransferase [Candidatus Gracilibacteria bacterium]